MGLLAGTCIGAGLAMLFAPRSGSDLRQRMADSAKDLGERASAQYQQASTRVGRTVDDLTRKGRDVRNDVADTVARGAKEVEQFATAAKSAIDNRKSSTADRSSSKSDPL